MARKSIIKLIAAIFVLGGMGSGVAACNTVEGVGKDVNAVGKGVSRGARKTKDAM